MSQDLWDKAAECARGIGPLKPSPPRGGHPCHFRTELHPKNIEQYFLLPPRREGDYRNSTMNTRVIPMADVITSREKSLAFLIRLNIAGVSAMSKMINPMAAINLIQALISSLMLHSQPPLHSLSLFQINSSTSQKYRTKTLAMTHSGKRPSNA
jgi:hypothetical protein